MQHANILLSSVKKSLGPKFIYQNKNLFDVPIVSFVGGVKHSN